MSEYRTLSEEEFLDLESRILYEDNHLMIVTKNVGEITQGDASGDEPLTETFKAFIAQRNDKPGKVFLGLPHRLDRPVSGICVFAKTGKALSRLDEMFRTSQVHKRYWALCCAAPDVKEGHLEDWLVRNERQNKSYVSNKGAAGAKLAKLNYTLIGSTDRYHLIEVELLTGRHHQIRCQLSHMGCVIKGDLKYGAPRSNPDGGICLHSRRISFIHPVSKLEIDVTAPVPPTWRGVQDSWTELPAHTD